jgi:hypothetical protein
MGKVGRRRHRVHKVYAQKNPCLPAGRLSFGQLIGITAAEVNSVAVIIFN